MNDLRFLLRYSMRGMFFVDLMIMYRVYILVLQSTSSTKNIDRPSKRERKLDGMPCAFNCQVNASVEVFLAVCLYYVLQRHGAPTYRKTTFKNQRIYLFHRQQPRSEEQVVLYWKATILYSIYSFSSSLYEVKQRN
jgi:hypothetical protein